MPRELHELQHENCIRQFQSQIWTNIVQKYLDCWNRTKPGVVDRRVLTLATVEINVPSVMFREIARTVSCVFATETVGTKYGE